MIGISPKCLQKQGKDFLSTTGKLYPCCWIYSRRHELEDWAKRYNKNIDDLDLAKYTVRQVKSSDFWKSFFKSFDTDVCRQECSKNSWTNTRNNKRGNDIV